MLTDFLKAEGFFAIPLTATKAGHFMLSILIENQPFRFILDTGAGSTVLDIGIAEQNNFITKELEESAGGLGTSEMKIYKTPPVEIKIGDLTITQLPVFCLDLSHETKALLKKGIEEPAQGVLGADVLLRHKAIIDYGSNTLFLAASV